MFFFPTDLNSENYIYTQYIYIIKKVLEKHWFSAEATDHSLGPSQGLIASWLSFSAPPWCIGYAAEDQELQRLIESPGIFYLEL